MSSRFPEGWFERGLLWWGSSLDRRTRFSQGARLEVPDMRAADSRTLRELSAQNGLFLASLGQRGAFQVHWTIESDYGRILDAYTGVADAGDAWCRRSRAVRRRYYDQRLGEQSLCRERVYFYLGRSCEDLGSRVPKRRIEADLYLRQVRSGFDIQWDSLRSLYTLGRWTPFGDLEHCGHLRKFLNPSLSPTVLSREGDCSLGFNPDASVRGNCLRSELNAFSLGSAGGREDVLMLDGCYHGLFVMRALPRATRPGMLLPILAAATEGICITLNVYPLAVDAEIERLRGEIAELSLFLGDKKSLGVEHDIANRRARIESLLSSVTIPFKMLFVVRVWDRTQEGLSAKMLAVKSSLYRIEGAEFMQVTSRARAVRLFHETIPGHLGSDYRGWDIYVENRNLVDLMPISATFTGHLGEEQALYDSPAGGLVGVRLMASDGTPQHSMIVGANGSGKSAFLIDLMSQTQCYWGYRFYQEEGLAFATLAQLGGMESLVLRESGERTLNPFDTLGLPLTGLNIASVVRTCMKLVGLSRDDDRNKRRESLIAGYVYSHFSDAADDWKNRDEGRWHRLARRAVLAERMRGGHDEFIDGFTSLGDRERSDPHWVAESLEGIGEEEVMAFSTSRQGEQNVMAMVFSELRAEEYPQFSGLVSLMRHARMPHHRGGAIADEMDFLSTELGKGKRQGGLVGPFIDGVSNLNLVGPGLHFDTSYVADGLLKELASFMVFDRVRQHMVTLPRSVGKVMVLDELRRILAIPGASEFVKEALAQMRKYRCVFIGAFQEASQIDELDPALTDLLLGQCKQHFLFRQNNSDQVDRIARVIGLPQAARRAVREYPLVEHQKGDQKAALLTYFCREGGTPHCGSVRVELDPHMLYVANSSGKVFEERMRAAARYPSAYEAVLGEVARGGRARGEAPVG